VAVPGRTAFRSDAFGNQAPLKRHGRHGADLPRAGELLLTHAASSAASQGLETTDQKAHGPKQLQHASLRFCPVTPQQFLRFELRRGSPC
jgi:hypothetical protein